MVRYSCQPFYFALKIHKKLDPQVEERAMIRNLLAFIGILAIAAGAYFAAVMPGMLQIMPGMLSSGMKPIVEVINKNPQGLMYFFSVSSSAAAMDSASG